MAISKAQQRLNAKIEEAKQHAISGSGKVNMRVLSKTCGLSQRRLRVIFDEDDEFIVHRGRFVIDRYHPFNRKGDYIVEYIGESQDE